MNINLLNDSQLASLRGVIDSAQKIVIVCHVNADGDALGSTLAWADYLRQQEKEATVIAPDMYPDFLQWMPGTQNIIRFDKKKEIACQRIKEADLICCMDLNTLSRSGEELAAVLQERIDSIGGVLLIDHHLDPDIPTRCCISFPEMSSASMIVFCIIWQLGGFDAMTKEMAVNIYCGMMTDTGGFTYNSTSPEVFYIISQLLSKGIDKDKIYRNIYHVYSVDRMRLVGYVLYQKMKVLTPLRVSYYTISTEEQKRFHFIKGDAEGLVNIPLKIKGHRLSISLREDSEKKNLVWVSLRSVDDFPCNEMAAQFFNGGGHKNASGGKLFCSLAEAEVITRKAINAFSKLLCFIAFFFMLAIPATSYAQSQFVECEDTCSHVHGIDISHYQGEVFWETISESKMAYCYIKATEGGDRIDSRYEQNLKIGHDYGIKVGSYHFYRPKTDQETQLNNFLVQCKPSEQDIIPMIDIETTGGLPTEEFCDSLFKFLELVEHAYRQRPLLYTGANFYNRHLAGKIDRYLIMIAQYTATEPKLSDERDITMWQYTGKGHLNGIRGYVDKSRFMGDHKLRELKFRHRKGEK